MGKHTEQALAEALKEAQRLREQGEAPHCVAKTLLSVHYRSGFLVHVLKAAEQ